MPIESPYKYESVFQKYQGIDNVNPSIKEDVDNY